MLLVPLHSKYERDPCSTFYSKGPLGSQWASRRVSSSIPSLSPRPTDTKALHGIPLWTTGEAKLLPPVLPPVQAQSMFLQVRCPNRCSRHVPPSLSYELRHCWFHRFDRKILRMSIGHRRPSRLYVTHKSRRTDPMINMQMCFTRSFHGRAAVRRRRRCLIRI